MTSTNPIHTVVRRIEYDDLEKHVMSGPGAERVDDQDSDACGDDKVMTFVLYLGSRDLKMPAPAQLKAALLDLWNRCSPYHCC